VIPLGERHLQRVLAEYQRYYNESRCHSGLGKDSPEPREIEPPEKGAGLVREKRVGAAGPLREDRAARGAVRAWRRAAGGDPGGRPRRRPPAPRLKGMKTELVLSLDSGSAGPTVFSGHSQIHSPNVRDNGVTVQFDIAEPSKEEID